jgi:hypothetical protein
MQKYRRELKHTGIENLPIGFAVYEANGVRGRLGTDFFANTKSCARSPAFINLREASQIYIYSQQKYFSIVKGDRSLSDATR